MYKRIKNGLIGEKNAVFFTFYINEREKLYENIKDEDAPDKIKKIEGFKFLLCFRADCRMGFIGGIWDKKKESMIDALLRETMEETPSFLPIVREKIKNKEFELITHRPKEKKNSFHIHTFLIPLSIEEFDLVIEKIPKAFSPEITGFNIVHVIEPKNYGKKKDKLGIYNLIKNKSIVDGCKESIIYLLRKFLSKESFEDMIKKFKIPKEVYEIKG